MKPIMPFCLSAIMQPSCWSVIMLISHNSYQPSWLSAIIPISYNAYQPSYLLTIMVINNHAYTPFSHHNYHQSKFQTFQNALQSFHYHLRLLTFKLFSLLSFFLLVDSKFENWLLNTNIWSFYRRKKNYFPILKNWKLFFLYFYASQIMLFDSELNFVD